MFLDLKPGTLTEVISGRRWDAKEIVGQVDTRVLRYWDLGMRAGDRVFLHYGNRLEFFVDLLAIWRIGSCAIPIDVRLTVFEVKTLTQTANPRFSLVDDQTDSAIIDQLKLGDVTILNTLDSTSINKNGGEGVRLGNYPVLDADALILFTSGSTGSPKGVVHTHRSLRAKWVSLQQSLGIESFRRTLCLLPTHFGHGLICNCLFPWLSGQDLVIAPPFKPDLVTKLGSIIDTHKITFLSSVPSLWRLALKLGKPPVGHTLERVHCGSAPLSGYLWKEIQRWTGTLQVFNTYGITETGSWVAGLTTPNFTPQDGLIGEPWGAVIKVLKTGDTKTGVNGEMECAVGEPGYIWLNTPALMKGYFNREDLTHQVVCQGWFMTGDIGFLDDRGRLYLKGRERDEINKGGMKIYPADVDMVVEQFPLASDVATFGFDEPRYGQEVGMAVVLKDQEDSTVRDLYQWMKTHLAEHKLPVRWYVLASIPRTSRGKINRNLVMEQCRQLSPLNLHRILQYSKNGSR